MLKGHGPLPDISTSADEAPPASPVHSIDVGIAIFDHDPLPPPTLEAHFGAAAAPSSHRARRASPIVPLRHGEQCSLLPRTLS